MHTCAWAMAVAPCPDGLARQSSSCCHWNPWCRHKTQIRSSNSCTAQKRLRHRSSGLPSCTCSNTDNRSHSSAGRNSTKARGGTKSVRSSSIDGSADDILALDVEYVHLAPVRQQRLGRERVSILPAEVCLAAPDGVIAFHSFCRPGTAACDVHVAKPCCGRLDTPLMIQ